MDGDGFDDLAAAPAGGQGTDGGLIYYGGAAAPLTPAPLPSLGGLVGYGDAVGDIDADGYDDVLIGAVHEDGTGGVGLFRGYADADFDGSPLPDDCDDANPLTHPGAVDLPSDHVDENCDGAYAHGCDCAVTPTRASLSFVPLLAALAIRRRR